MRKSILSGILVMLMLLCPVALSAQKTISGYHEWDILGQVHAGIPIGVTKNFGSWFLDARYTFNLNKLPDTDAAKMLFDDGGLVHALQFTIGYKFQMM